MSNPKTFHPRRPTEPVEAMQFEATHERVDDIWKWVFDMDPVATVVYCLEDCDDGHPEFEIRGSTFCHATPGDWIVLSYGEFRVLPDETFRLNYEEQT